MEIKPLYQGLDPEKPLFIAGPCSAETEKQVMETALSLKDTGVQIFRAGVWKPRTTPGNFEGVGSVGLRWLRRVKRETGMKIAVEVATAAHVRQALRSGIDIVWIGARTTANPFAVEEIAGELKGHDIGVMIKNPLNPDIDAWSGAIQRLQLNGIERVVAIHRGFSSSTPGIYRNTPEWRIPIELQRRIPGVRVITDPSHIAGEAKLVNTVARHAMAIGFCGLMVEVHCNPEFAWSDARQQLTPTEFTDLINSLENRNLQRDDTLLSDLRQQIDDIDSRLIKLLSQRMNISSEIGDFKRRNGMAVVQPDRYDSLMIERVGEALAQGLSEPFIRSILQKIHEESVNRQL